MTEIIELSPQAQTVSLADHPLRRLAAAGFDTVGLKELLAPNPRLLARVAALTEYTVCDAELSPRLRALLILLTTRLLDAGPLWDRHARLAAALGLPDPITTAIRDGRRPEGLDGGETTLYQCMLELLTQRRIATASFADAVNHFDERSMVDAFGVVGTFALHAVYTHALGAGSPVAFGTSAVFEAMSFQPMRPENADEPRRYHPLRAEDLSLHQRQIVNGESYRNIMQIGTGLAGPNGHIMRSPGLMGAFYPFAEYCKCDPVLPAVLREIVIITTGRLWSSAYEWSAHGPTALSVGVRPDIVRAIGEGTRPTDMTEREATVFDFCCQLHYDGALSPDTRTRLFQLFDPIERLDIASIHGEYVLLAATLNAYRVAPWPDRIEPMREMATPFR